MEHGAAQAHELGLYPIPPPKILRPSVRPHICVPAVDASVSGVNPAPVDAILLIGIRGVDAGRGDSQYVLDPKGLDEARIGVDIAFARPALLYVRPRHLGARAVRDIDLFVTGVAPNNAVLDGVGQTPVARGEAASHDRSVVDNRTPMQLRSGVVAVNPAAFVGAVAGDDGVLDLGAAIYTVDAPPEGPFPLGNVVPDLTKPDGW